MNTFRLWIVKGLLTFTILLSIPLNIFALYTTDQKVQLERLMEKADSLSEVDGRRALLITRHLVSERGTPSDSIHAEILLIDGTSYFSLGEFDKVMESLQTSLKISKQLNNPALMARAHSGMGVVCRIYGKLDTALQHYQEALKLFRKCKNPDYEAETLASLAILYFHADRYQDSEKFARMAYEVAKNCKQIAVRIYVLNNYGSILYQNGKQKQGTEKLQASVRMAEHQPNPKYLLKVYSSLMGLYYLAENRDSVEVYLQKGRELLPRVPKTGVEALGFLQQSAVILARYGRYQDSNHIWELMLNQPSTSKFVAQHRVYQMMAHNYKALHQYNKMEEMYENAIALGDSLRASEIDQQLSDFNVQYGTAQKELQIAKMEADKAHSLSLLTLFISILVIIVMILASDRYIRERQRRKTEELQRVRERLEGVEQERARLAKDLHDGICNDLLGVSIMLQMEDCQQDEISQLVANIREEVRTLSHNLLPPKFHSLNIDQLFQSMEQKTPNFIHYYSEHDAPWNTIGEDVSYQLYRIVQELVSNVKKHTCAESMLIDMKLCQKELRLELSHQGEIKDLNLRSNKGIGLETMRRRLMLIGATMTHVDEEKHKRVIIALKLQ